MQLYTIFISVFITSFLHVILASKNSTSNNRLYSTENQLEKNLGLATSLSHAFKTKESSSMSFTHLLHRSGTLTMPFKFPIFPSYDMDMSIQLSKTTGIAPLRILAILVQIIYRLIQCHVARLFKLDHFEPFVPKTGKYSNMELDKNPEQWFNMLLGAIMPGAVVRPLHFNEFIEVLDCNVKPFQHMTRNNSLEYLSYEANGKLARLLERFGNENAIPIYSLPPILYARKLPPSYTILTTIILEKSYPHHNEILEHLLKGVDFEFDLSKSEIEIVVRPNQHIPSVEESKRVLKKLFATPIKTSIIVPNDIEDTLSEGGVPKASCYHPAKISFGSPETYERVLMTIILGRIQRLLVHDSQIDDESVKRDLETFLKRYIPNCSLKERLAKRGAPEDEVCVYDPKTFNMMLYRETRADGKLKEIFLDLGAPKMLNHIQMAEINLNVFPFLTNISKPTRTNKPVLRILAAAIEKLKGPTKVKRRKKRAVPILPNTKVENEITRIDTNTIMEQLGRIAFHFTSHNGSNGNRLNLPMDYLLTPPDSSFGTYRVAGVHMNSFGERIRLTIPTLYPMPIGSIFAVSLKSGIIVRSKVPLIFIGMDPNNLTALCDILWWAEKDQLTGEQILGDDEIFELVYPS